jgi:hypothetical protein
MSRMELVVLRKGSDDKTYSTKIGSAFPTKDGNGWMLTFDALPMPGPDGCKVLMKPPYEKPAQDAPPRASGGRTARSPGSAVPHHVDDEVPF